MSINPHLNNLFRVGFFESEPLNGRESNKLGLSFSSPTIFTPLCIVGLESGDVQVKELTSNQNQESYRSLEQMSSHNTFISLKCSPC